MTEPLGLTPSQTVGPFLHIGLSWPDGADAVAEGTPGAIVVDGHLYDGAGEVVTDAIVEIWQAGPRAGFGRSDTTDGGHWWIRTVKPTALPTADGATEAPHLDISVFARGLLDRVVTRCYFADDDTELAADPVLGTVDPDRRATLIAAPVPGGYRFDIRLQGDGETVFFDV